MKNRPLLLIILVATFSLGFIFSSVSEKQPENLHKAMKDNPIKLGAFSISLNVKNLEASRKFYEALGFTVFGGGMEKRYLIMKNGNALIGIFQGMFEGSMLTFNPGWDENAQNVEKFDDVRDIQRHLRSNNVKLTMEADEKTTGPASVMLTDPDGNVILIDQHR